MVDVAGALTDVGVLGPLRLRIGGSWTAIAAPRQRMVLGVLLAHTDEVVTADRLLHEAWNGNPPNAGVQALRYHLSRLRDLLAPGRGRGDEGPIRTVGSGYQLVAASYRTDADHFEELATRGARSAAAQQWPSAVDAFDEALALWRGGAWADFRYEDFAQPEIRRLEERRLICLEDRIDARLAAGASREVLAELHELTTRHPARERFWAQTMVALHRAGRGAEAARVYEAARRALEREVGAEPGTLLQRLHRSVVDESVHHDDVPAVTPPPAPVSDEATRAAAPAVEATAARAATSRGTPGDTHPAWTPGDLLERDEELAMLRHELSTAEHGGGRVVLVRGEAGIGKSVLVRHFLATAAEDAVTYLGTCDDLDAPQPWAPLWDVARDRTALGAALHDGDRRRVMEATLEVVTPPSGPAILVVEDTQWADDATLDVIMYVGRRIERTRGILLLTFRDRAVDDDHPLRRVLGTLPAGTVTRIQPALLSEQAVRTMAGDSSRDPVALAAVTGGNPLFVSEMLATDDGALPRSIRDAVLARLSRLSLRSRQLAELVSVVPGRTSWTTVEDVLGTEPLGTRQAVRHGLLDVDDDGVTYRHELQRRAVEASLTPRERRRLHQQVLAALDPDDTEPARLAHHARHAHDTDALLTHARRAGRRALAAQSHREAADHFRSIDAMVDQLPAHEAADVVESWARAAWHVDARASVPIVVRGATLRRVAGDPVALARTLAFGAFVLQLGQRGEEGAAWAAEAVEILERDGPSHDLAYALTERARALAFMNDPAAADVADRAIAVAEEVGHERTAVSATISAGLARAVAGDPDGRAMIDRARSHARRGGHHFEEANACAMLAFVALRLRGDLEAAIEDLGQARALAAEHEFLELLAFVDSFTAMLQMWSGDWGRAEDAAAAVLTTVAPADAQVLARCVVGLLATRRGRDGADELVRLAWARASRFGTSYMLYAAGAVVAEHLWVTGDQHAWIPGPDELPRYDDGIVRGFDHERLLFWGALSDRSRGTPAGIDRGYAAILDGDVEEAAAIWSERDHDYEQAIALLHGSPDDGIRAVRMLEDLGANGTAARGRELLRERGVAVPRGRSRAAREHAAGLTRRQAEVLELLAVGCSNLEIADELFISRRTVENHVTEVLRRLDAGDRDEAVATARARGLLDGG